MIWWQKKSRETKKMYVETRRKWMSRWMLNGYTHSECNMELNMNMYLYYVTRTICIWNVCCATMAYAHYYITQAVYWYILQYVEQGHSIECKSISIRNNSDVNDCWAQCKHSIFSIKINSHTKRCFSYSTLLIFHAGWVIIHTKVR